MPWSLDSAAGNWKLENSEATIFSSRNVFKDNTVKWMSTTTKTYLRVYSVSDNPVHHNWTWSHHAKLSCSSYVRKWAVEIWGEYHESSFETRVSPSSIGPWYTTVVTATAKHDKVSFLCSRKRSRFFQNCPHKSSLKHWQTGPINDDLMGTRLTSTEDTNE